MSRTKKTAKEKMIDLNYDKEADVLYIKFNQAKVVDNKALDENGMILASLDKKGKIIGIIVMDASSVHIEQ